MIRFKSIVSVAVAVTSFSIFASESARADSRSPIYCAADAYREAVREFERHVLRTRYIERIDERLVDDLEDSTARLRSAARDHRRLDRLSQRFAETDRLHCRVESVFFAQPIYPPNPQLDLCWREVSRAYAVLVNELRQLQIIRGSLYSSQLGRLNNDRYVPVPGKPILSSPLAAPPVVVPVPPVVDPATGQYPAGVYPGSPRPPVLAPSFGRSSATQRPVVPGDSRRSITISTRDQLRQAIIGAILQRR